MITSRVGRIAALLLACSPGVAAGQPSDAASLLTAYMSKTSVSQRCRQSVGSDEILVCSRREADRYRVPFIAPGAGDPSIQDVPSERAHLIARANPCAELAAILVGCGMVGVSAGLGGGSDGKLRLRPIAP